MANENIAFPYQHFAFADGLFYLFDHVYSTVFAKLQDGTIAYSYPTIESFGGIYDAHFDGIFFWTLEDGTATTEDLIIRKWKIEKPLVQQVARFDLIGAGNPTHRFDGVTFSLEHYHMVCSVTASGGNSYFYVDDATKIELGSELVLGPNQDGDYEQVTVTGTVDNKVLLNFYLDNTYAIDDRVTLTKYVYLFNNYANRVSEGAIYKFKASNMEYIEHTEDNEFKNVTASTFDFTNASTQLGDDNYSIIYVKNTNVKFLDPADLSFNVSMVIDNLESNGSTLIPVYALQIHANTLYRLQLKSMNYDVNNTFSNPAGHPGPYNYVMSPIGNYVDTIIAGVYPTVLPANGVNTASMAAVVRDQYGDPFKYRPTFFNDDDDYGFCSAERVDTWLDGVARNTYRAGIEPRTVTIAIYVKQSV